MSIEVQTLGAVMLITINRPEAHNSIDHEHNRQLTDAVVAFEADPAARVAVLTGAGDRAFSAGGDLKTLIPDLRDSIRAGDIPEWNLGGLTRGRRSKPVIAAVNGHALAGGLELALACDIRLAAPTATFGLTETKWAIIPGAGGTVRLPRVVPLGIAMEMVLTGEGIDAKEAHRIGLVNRIVPLAELRGEALRLAAVIASRGPLAVVAARASILAAVDLDESAAIEEEFGHFVDLMRSEDALEGPRAFAERREPVYRGR